MLVLIIVDYMLMLPYEVKGHALTLETCTYLRTVDAFLQTGESVMSARIATKT